MVFVSTSFDLQIVVDHDPRCYLPRSFDHSGSLVSVLAFLCAYDVVLSLPSPQWLGDVYADPKLFEPGRADKHNLQAFYDKLSPVVRNNDPNRLLFYEPTVVISQVRFIISIRDRHCL